MGQYWKLYNLDKRQVCEPRSAQKLGEFIFASGDLPTQMKMILHRLAKTSTMIRYIERDILPGITKQAESNQNIPESKILNFPNEVLDTICGCIDGLDNIVYFALTCPRFWEIGKRHITLVRDGLIAEKLWSGDRVICAGDGQEPDDWPSSIPEEEYKLYLEKEEWPNPDDHLHLLDPESISNFYQMSMKMTKSEQNAWKYICEEYNDGRSLILRNLSKKLYVDETGFDKLFEGCDDKRPKKLTLGHIALIQVCWSSEDSTSLNVEGLHRGKWAGDRLDIVSTKRHQIEVKEATKALQDGSPDRATGFTEESEWKDVTDECMKLMEEIWRSDYGDGWRKNTVWQPPLNGPRYLTRIRYNTMGPYIVPG